MSNKITHAKSNVEGDSKEIIYSGDLDKTDYETKYKGYLTCVRGCPARIKFTEKKNSVRFFSTWNKEGHLHMEGCPYHVDYRGRVGRNRLIAYYENIVISEEDILRRLQRKMAGILKQYSAKDIVDPPNGSLEVDIVGEDEVGVFDANDNGTGRDYAPRIHYVDAEYISTDYVGCRMSVYGFINNIQLEEDSNRRKYAYFNLSTRLNNVSIAFPEAFYSNELSAGVQEFETFVDNVKTMVDNNQNKICVMAYGDITKKKRDKDGVNVTVISPNRILVNNKTYNQIVHRNI
ncbi:MAG: hypothetical protein E7257_06990 [Lachnospiraceae bacterium]|nr:hypothetical protein [Lachnospiraceae bacterium]